MRKLIVFLLIVGGLLFGANSAFGWYQRETDLPAAPQPESITFKVTSGETSAEIADDLYSKGLIRNREVFQLYVRLNDLAPTFQAGEYALDRHMTMRQVTEALKHSQVDQFSFTIPEGYSIGRTAKKWEAENHGTAQSYIDAANPANWTSFDFVAQRPKVAARADNLEGYLLPETYSLNKSATARDLVKAQLEQFQKLLTPQLRNSIQSQGQTVDKIVILASMVDREIQTDPNRAIVCGIYYNRLALPNTLDVDATILYALGRTSGVQYISEADKQAAAGSPYNTYTHQGLPPGPISNPGTAAINACVNPLQRDHHLLFYFADCKGVTHFSKTPGEQQAQIKQFGVVGDGC